MLELLAGGILDLAWWQLVLVALLLTHITIASVTIYLHRCQAHRALSLHPIVAHFFRFWLWLTTGMQTYQWVAVHRYHHARCETSEDPHSPQILGIDKVLLEGAELYRDATVDEAFMRRYSHGTPNDWLEKHVYQHSFLGIILMLIINLLLFGALGLSIWAVQMIWIPFFAAGVINGLGHYWGYRNFASPDAATNISPWGILIGGEELHNNHHAFPSSAKLSAKWWEFDIGWLYIRVLSFFRLAKLRRVALKPLLSNDKHIDMDTVKAVITHRMHVLANYAREVVRPVTQQELCRSEEHCRKLARQARRLLASDRLDAVGKARLQEILQQSQVLRTVHQYRRSLQAIWEKTASSQEALLESLQAWCHAAEATGIQALEDFSRSLRGYRPAVN